MIVTWSSPNAKAGAEEVSTCHFRTKLPAWLLTSLKAAHPLISIQGISTQISRF